MSFILCPKYGKIGLGKGVQKGSYCDKILEHLTKFGHTNIQKLTLHGRFAYAYESINTYLNKEFFLMTSVHKSFLIDIPTLNIFLYFSSSSTTSPLVLQMLR